MILQKISGISESVRIVHLGLGVSISVIMPVSLGLKLLLGGGGFLLVLSMILWRLVMPGALRRKSISVILRRSEVKKKPGAGAKDLTSPAWEDITTYLDEGNSQSARRIAKGIKILD